MKNILLFKDYIFPLVSKIILLLLILLITYFIVCNNYNYYKSKNNYNKYDIRFVICNSPSHYNFGDEAILMSTQQFLKYYFPQFKQITITRNQIAYNFHLIKYIINNNDIIIINGGGYFGLYETYIREQAKIVKTFKNNHIIFFPCTILNPNKHKKNEYRYFINIFNNHKNITLFTRESKSYQVASSLFKNITIYNVPDIATRLNLSFVKKNKKREGILLIFRNNEVLLDEKDRKTIEHIAQKYFNNIYKRNSKKKMNKTITELIKKKETFEFINFIAERELVITDRLHGAILSIITGTPCIIFGNRFHKVESSFNSWFKNFSYISFIERKDIEKKLEKTIIRLKNIYNSNSSNYDYNIFNNYYLLMKNIIQAKIDLIKKY